MARTYPIYWLQHYTNDEPQDLYMGICGKTWRPFTLMAGLLAPAVIGDFSVRGTRCSEAFRCMNTDCELNRTTVASYRRSMGWKGEPIPGFEIRPITMTPRIESAIRWLKAKHEGGILPASSLVH